MTQDPGLPRKIVWAVDVFEDPAGPLDSVAQVVRRLQWKGQVAIQPVHVLSPTELNLSSELPSFWVAEYLPSARQSIQRFIRELGLLGIEPPEVLVQPVASTAKAAAALLDYAERVGAEMVLVGTHARRGISRILLGSFAESLLLRSRIPVLSVSSRLKGEVDFGRALLPTGFGVQAKEIFRRAVRLAKGLGSSITIYHAIPRPIEPVYHSGIYMLGAPYMASPPWLTLQDFHQREADRQRQHAEAWARWARNQGVAAEAWVEKDVVRVAESILEAARARNAGWIAMGAYHGPWAAALLGSITRRVVREAECPVWVMHPPKRGAAQAPADEIRAA